MSANRDPHRSGENRTLPESGWARSAVLRETSRRRSILLALFATLSLAAFLLFVSTKIATAADTGPVYSVEDLGSLGGSDTISMDVNESGQVVGYSQLTNGQYRPFIYEDGEMRDLGTLGGGFAFAGEINEVGQVAGSSLTTTNFRRYHAFIYSDGQMKDIGTLGGNESYPLDINDSGEVVGYSYTSNNSSDYSAFLYSDGRMIDLQNLLEGGSNDSYSFAVDINNSGQAVGYSRKSGSVFSQRAFLYSDGQVTELGGLGGNNNFATSINDSEQIAGTSSLPNGDYRAVIHSGGQVKDLGVTGDHDESSVVQINENGDVVGHLYRSGDDIRRAFLYSDGEMVDLGTFGQYDSIFATDLNDSGQVVGHSFDNTSYTQRRVFVYSDGQLKDLDDLIPAGSGIALEDGFNEDGPAINNRGQILVDGKNANGQRRAFLLTPEDEGPTTTATRSPEPNEAGFNNEDVTITLDAKDVEGGSGVKGITYKVGNGQPETVQGSTAEIEISEEGTTTISYFAKDNAGNKESEKSITVKIDTGKPTASISIPPNGTEYFIGDEVFADYECTDEDGGSGIESCTAETIDGPVNDGDAINTSEVGNHLLTVTATDKAGNKSTKQTTYTVAERPDTTPPGEVSDIQKEVGNGYVIFRWDNPTDEDFELVRIFRSTEGKITDPENTDNLVHEGDYNENDFSEYDLTNGTQYTYTFMTRDITGNWSEGVTEVVTPDQDKATVELSDLTRTYDGQPQAPTVTTDPDGLEVDLTYTDENGDPVENPTNAGTYDVTATVDNFDFKGSTTGELVIEKAPLTVTANDATREYGTADPDFTVEYLGFVGGEDESRLNGTLAFETQANGASPVGNYPIVPSGLGAKNYEITFESGTLSVTKATAAITLSDLIHAFDGTPKAAKSVTDPNGLKVDIVYSQNGESVESPTNPGNYDVSATVNDRNYRGSQSGILRIKDASPETTITAGPSGATFIKAPNFRYSGTDDKTPTPQLFYSYQIDGGPWSKFVRQPTVTLNASGGLSDGSHIFRVKARDADGNEDRTPAERRFVVDTKKPSGSVAIREETFDPQTKLVRLDINATDGNGTGTLQMRLATVSGQFGAWEPLATSKEQVLPTKQGRAAYVYIQFRDEAGNLSPVYTDYMIF